MKKASCKKIVSKLSTVVLILFLMFFVSGCINLSPIVDKLAIGQELTAEEADIYKANKDDIDHAVKEKKREIEATHYKEATDAEISAGKRIYKRRKKDTQSEFDITPEACKEFGFLPGTKIQLPSGRNANIVGVFDGHLWFHVEGVDGATFSGNNNLEEFTKEGYKIISEEAKSVDKRAVPPAETDSTEEVSAKSDANAQTSSSKIDNQENSDDESDKNKDEIYFKPIKRIPYLKRGK